MYRIITKLIFLGVTAGLAFGCAHTRITWQEFGPDGKPVRAGSYYSNRDTTGKITRDPVTGAWTIDLTGTASTASAAQGTAVAGTIDALAIAAGKAAGVAARETVKPGL